MGTGGNFRDDPAIRRVFGELVVNFVRQNLFIAGDDPDCGIIAAGFNTQDYLFIFFHHCIIPGRQNLPHLIQFPP